MKISSKAFEVSLCIALSWYLSLYQPQKSYAQEDICNKILPKESKKTLLPLIPNSYWDYTIKIYHEPQYMRWYTENFQGGYGLMGIGWNSFMEYSNKGEYKIRYMMTNEKKIISRDAQRGCLFKIRSLNITSQKEIPVDEELYWGHWQSSGVNRAIVEVRLPGSITRQLLGSLDNIHLDTLFHFRYLSTDFRLHWPRYNELTVGVLNVAYGDKWQVKSHEGMHKVDVPAGHFATLLTTFEFEGMQEKKVIEKLYYAPEIGLVKWEQFIEGRPIWSAELLSYSFPKQ